MGPIDRTAAVLSVSIALTMAIACGGNPTGPLIPPTIAPSPYGSPIWRPDGATIAFNHHVLKRIYRDPVDGLYHYEFDEDSVGFWFINPDGTNQRLILEYPPGEYGLGEPTWSPDGQWIAYEQGGQIYKVRVTAEGLDLSSRVQLTSGGRNFYPTWSPDGQWIAYDSNAGSPNGMYFIWKMRADGTERRRIVYEPTSGEIRMPNWSPDGSTIVHIRYVVGEGESRPEIFVMDTSGLAPQRLTFNTSDDRSPIYSPDGSQITFLSQPKGGGLVQVWLMNADGNQQRPLTTEGVIGGISWSPDSRELVYVSYRFLDYGFGNGTLWIIDVASGAKRQLTFNRPP